MPQTRPEHDPLGDPCTQCGVRAASHRRRKRVGRTSVSKIDKRVEHDPIGDPCAECGLDVNMHRKRKRKYRKQPYKYKNTGVIGVDGEGFESGSVYAYLCAATVEDEVDHVERIQGLGLSTRQCLDFLVGLPRKPKKFGFSLGYDYTHILKDLDNESLWKLCHPESRMPLKGPPTPVRWSPVPDVVYELNFLSNRLSVKKYDGHSETCKGEECRACKFVGKCILWDIFKFFQSSFIAACRDWDVISEDEFRTLKKMKDGRSEFKRPPSEDDADWVEVKRYCALECRKMADLGQRLIDAHNEAGLELDAYYGAGSTGGVMLESMQARKFARKQFFPYDRITKKTSTKPTWGRIKYPKELEHAIGSAFFGGRFEISKVGPHLGEVWSYDISSAYPYAMCFLPCLVHGTWEHRAMHDGLQAEVEKASAALVRYELPHARGVGKINTSAWPKSGKPALDSAYYGTCERAWGPLPFRDRNGNILYPAVSGGGWVYKREFLAAQRTHPNVKLISAWIYNTDCDCRVFKDAVPRNYKLRLSWGKEGRGIVVKLGMNSCYGKMAQNKGKNPKYQSFLWAGMTTSSCRAQLLLAIHAAKKPESILSVATDGIMSAERLELPRPADTGTFEPVNGKSKPLGGWEEKRIERGMMLIRPGIVFSFDDPPKDKYGQIVGDKETKARGVGKALLERRQGEVMDRWYTPGVGDTDMQFEKQLFFGMKSQVQKTQAGEYRRYENYGRFAPMPQKVSYYAQPKRPAVYWPGRDNQLLTWALPPNLVSEAYGPAVGEKPVLSEDAKTMKKLEMQDLEQPDYEDSSDEFGMGNEDG